MVKGAIFDFNGTLFLDSSKQEIAWRTFAQQHFDKLITDTEFIEHFHGRNNQYSLAYLAGHALTRAELNQLIDEKEMTYRALCKADQLNFHLTPGTENFLDDLKKSGYKLTIATASGEDNLNFYFQSFQLTRWFNLQDVIYDNGHLKSKPDPDPYIKALAKLDLVAEQSVVFEDALSGINAARQAGIKQIVQINSMPRLENTTLWARDFTTLSTRTISELFAEQRSN